MLKRPALRALALGGVALLAALALAGCSRQPEEHSAQSEALRQRVERLERESAADRQRLDEALRALREDVAALRVSLDDAGQHLSALSGQAASQNATAAKSPRAALRESLREAMEASRQALERLNSGLEKSLARPKPQDSPAVPEK